VPLAALWLAALSPASAVAPPPVLPPQAPTPVPAARPPQGGPGPTPTPAAPPLPNPAPVAPPQGNPGVQGAPAPAPNSNIVPPAAVAPATPDVGAAEMPEMPPAVPAAQRLTLAQALTLADQNNLQIVTADRQVASAGANYRGQSAPLNPTLDFAQLNSTVSPPDFANISNYSAYVTIETSGRHRLRANQARAQLQGSRFDAQTARLAVRQGIADAYSALQVANAQLGNERDVYGAVAQLADLTERQFTLGAAPETNAISARIALTQEATNLVAAVTTVRTARAALNVQLGRAPEDPVDAAEPLAYAPVTVPAHDELVRQALENRPEIRSAAAARSALEAGVGLQRSQYFPDTVLGTSLAGGGIEVGLVVPIVDLGSIHGAVSKAKEDVRVQEAQEAQTRQNVQLDVENADIALTQAQKAVAFYQDGILPRSQSLLQRVTQGYGLGGNTVLDVINAQQTYRQARNGYYAALGSYQQAVDQLDRAVGALVVTTGTPTPTVPATTP